MSDKVEVLNINHPGKSSNVDGQKYRAIKKALLKSLPKKSPGLTQKEMISAAKSHLDETVFPGGAKAGWWVKTVQLDLEARGEMQREATKPLTWIRL